MYNSFAKILINNGFILTVHFYRCEKALMASVNVKNCVKLYTTADKIGAQTLKEHCSSLISAHWVRISAKKKNPFKLLLLLF